MKVKLLLLLIPLLSAATHAGYVDYRHEYYDDGRNYDRVYMSHRFATGFGVAVEAISRSDDAQSNDAWNNMESNGNEYTASYQFTWQGLVWQPGIAIETGDNIAIYKPYIRVQYNINDSWWTAFRYRLEYMRRNSDGKDDRMVYRPEAWLGYNVNNWMFELNGIYKVADSEDLYNNKKEDYEYNFRVAYNIGSWVPFVELGNVSSGYNTTTTDDRQTRYRVGLGYNFWLIPFVSAYYAERQDIYIVCMSNVPKEFTSCLVMARLPETITVLPSGLSGSEINLVICVVIWEPVLFLG